MLAYDPSLVLLATTPGGLSYVAESLCIIVTLTVFTDAIYSVFVNIAIVLSASFYACQTQPNVCQIMSS